MIIIIIVVVLALRFFDPDLPQLTEELNRDMGKKFYKLNAAIGSLVHPSCFFLLLLLREERNA